MKKFIILGLVIGLTLVSCDNEDVDTIFDGNGRETLLSFEQTTADLAIDINSVGSVNLVVEASSLSDVDRTYNVSIVPEDTDIVAGSVSVPNTVTIPAGSYEGTLTVTGNDINGEVDVVSRPLVLELASSDSNDGFTNQQITVSVFQVCPIPSDYLVGSYQIFDENPVFGGANFDPRDVDVMIGSTPTTRTFAASFFGRPQTVVLNLVCNELIFASTINTGFTSAGSAIILRPASDNDSTYDVSDDSAFSVEYDNEAGGNGTFEGSFFLVKN